MFKTSKNVLFVLSFVLISTHYCLSEVITEEVSIASLPPSVIKTMPQCGDDKVNPDLEKISVTFSKEMKVTGHCWSWCSVNDNTFPQLNGKTIFLDDKRTCVLQVKLEPEKTYAIWVNTDQYQSFQDPLGHRAVPYLLVFKTGPRS